MRNVVKLFLVVLLVTLLGRQAVVSQATTIKGGVSIKPAFEEIVISPRQSERQFTFSLTNHTNSTQKFLLSVVDFGSLDESGGVLFIGLTRQDFNYKYGLASWASLDKSSLTIAAGKTATTKVRITNRRTLRVGGHYGAVLVRPDTKDRTDDSNEVSFKQVASSLLFVKKVGGEIYKLDLNSVDIGHNLLTAPQRVNIRFQNSGNVHLVPRGTIKVTDSLGRQVADSILNPESGIVLPETYRVYEHQLKRTAWSWLPGRYHVRIDYRYSETEKFQTAEYTVFYLGFPAALLVVLVSTGVILLNPKWLAHRFKQSRQKTVQNIHRLISKSRRSKS